MAQPETEEERRNRAFEELKGKNIAHYSVMLSAWIQTKMEHDKTLVTLSAGGIGLLITIISLVGVRSILATIFFTGAFLGFLVTIGSALIIYQRNAAHIESELRGDQKDFKLVQLDRIINWSFMIGAICAILATITSTGGKQMAASTKTSTTQQLEESLQGIGKLAPEELRSLKGIENLAPSVLKQSTSKDQSVTSGAIDSHAASNQSQNKKSE